MLRATRRHPTADQWVSVSGADPLNLVGILTPGSRLPALAVNRLLYRDGIPTAVLVADDIQFLEALDDATEWTAQKELLRSSSEPSVTKGAPSSSHRVVKKNRLKASTFAAQFDIRLRNRFGSGGAQCPPRCSTDPRDVVCTRSTG